MDMEYDMDKMPYGSHGYGTIGVEGSFNELEAPLELRTALAGNTAADRRFAAMSSQERNHIANYICAARGEEKQQRIREVVQKLSGRDFQGR